jgi:hypothetical protein
MTINIAARRGAKNQRRKAAVLQKRKAEMEAGTISGRVRLASADPIQHCLLTQGLFEVGLGTLIVTRGATPHNLTMAGFLLDIHALGVKDAFLSSISGRTLSDHLDRIFYTAPMAPVDPSHARKLLHDLVVWARTLGFTPHRDYVKLEPIFGTVATACDVEFQFGFEGRPLFVGDLSDTGGIFAALASGADDVRQLRDQVMPAAAA